MHKFGLIDGIVPEPIGGAHWDYNEAAALLKPHLVNAINELRPLSPQERVARRIEKYCRMGFWDELPAGVAVSDPTPGPFATSDPGNGQ
jgi:acetyl-CoA carboxylase carboxyl transferase subunit alpha